MMHVSVNLKFQNKGYARKLLENIFDHAKKENKKLKISVYSEDGLSKVKLIIKELSEKTGVRIVD
jgi:GNAT superfamily N-acetyltransferase